MPTLSCGTHLVSSSLTRNWTQAPCIGSAESRTHWTTRVISDSSLYPSRSTQSFQKESRIRMLLITVSTTVLVQTTAIYHIPHCKCPPPPPPNGVSASVCSPFMCILSTAVRVIWLTLKLKQCCFSPQIPPVAFYVTERKTMPESLQDPTWPSPAPSLILSLPTLSRILSIPAPLTLLFLQHIG